SRAVQGSLADMEGTVKVDLPEYPYFEGTTMTPAGALLDELAAAYAERAGNALVMTRFLFGDVPVVLFDRIFATGDPAALPLGSYPWLYPLSGSFGGVWLRSELLRSGHNQMMANVNLPPTAEQFTNEVDDAQRILDDAFGDDVLAYNRASLFDQPNPDNP